MYKLISFLFLFTLYLELTASIDSILKTINSAQHDTLVCKIYLDCGDYYEYLNFDSAEYYYTKAEKTAKKHLLNNKKLSFRELYVYIDLYSKALRFKAILYLNNNQINKPIEQLLIKSLAYTKVTKNIKAQASCYTNLGVYYFQKSLFDKALINQLEALKLYEQMNDDQGLANVYMNIANIYTIQKEYNKAISAYLKSKKYLEKLNKDYHIARIDNNMAILYKYKKNFREAEKLYLQALEKFKKYNDSISIASTLNNIGVLAYEQAQYDKALLHYKEAINVNFLIKDTNGLILSYINYSECLITKYDSSEQKKIEWLYEALKYSKLAYEYNEKIGSLYSKNMAARCLMRIYYNLKEYKKAIEYSRIYVDTRDSLFSQEKSKAIAEAEALYKTEKQQRLIEKLKHEKELNLKTIQAQQAKNKQQQTTIYSIISVSILLAILLSVVVYFLRLNQIKNRKLTIKNYQISKQKEELANQRDEIREQRDIVLKQKLKIEAYHKALKDSIYYAENIQKAVIPDETYLKKILGNCFLIFLPRDIVSGDFYWIQEKDDTIYFAVADCTGHGVPGAFMSMMAVSFLNEQFHKNNLSETDKVLETLRNHLVQSFRLNENTHKMKDGLDMIFITYKKQTKELTYSGANNPLYIVRKNGNNLYNMIELTADKMPVGYHPNIKPFQKHTIILQPSDTLYFCSDGFGDQFGGVSGKKFLRKRLKELFVQIANNPLEIQQSILLETLHNWRNCGTKAYPQTDDITIVGWHI